MTIQKLHDIFLKSNGVNIDTRTIKENELFFAISGEKFDGNKFATQALEKGAAFAIIDNKNYIGEKTILVENTLETLQELAHYHRNHLNTPIISLTGSNGKTTTKELINAVLSKKYKTTATVGNLNNHIGVPLTLLSISKETEIGIIEMGANHLKEIEFLSTIADPDYGYITNFGKAHLEGFGSLEGVVKGKSELYDYLRKNNKVAFLNIDSPKQLQQSKGIKTYTFSESTNADVQIKFKEANPNVIIEHNSLIIKSNLIGKYNFTNIAAAVCIGNYFKVDTKAIKEAIENYIPTNNRSQIIYKNSNKIILDAYNANPTSMKAALDNFNQLEATNKTLFIGDMFEIGETSLKEHQEIVNYLTNLSINNIYIIGKEFKKTKHPKNFNTYGSFKEFSEGFKESLDNNTILIKGSRGMALERILDLL